MVDIKRIQSVVGVPSPGHGIGKSAQPEQTKNSAFAQALDTERKKPGQLRFSAHALERMTQRGIDLSPFELEQVKHAVDVAENKGSISSLVLLNDRALVISVANRTVITALDSEGLKDQVVTDIDSAVII